MEITIRNVTDKNHSSWNILGSYTSQSKYLDEGTRDHEVSLQVVNEKKVSYCNYDSILYCEFQRSSTYSLL